MGEPGWRAYDRDPEGFVRRYEAVSFRALHRAWLDLLPSEPGVALDVGAGSGRDAGALAGRGWEVHAVEPAERMRRIAADRHPSPRIRWIDDALPDLRAVETSGVRFDLILVSAVWMHVPVVQAAQCLRKLANLLRPGGVLVVSAKSAGAGPGQRNVPVDELTRIGRDHALETVRRVSESPDAEHRSQVEWCTTVLRLPDDGTGTLPIIRHIVVNDDKTATYKLALLRALLRIADGASGMAVYHEDEVRIPMGLVALYWARLYHPLLLGPSPLPQVPRSTGIGFRKAAFEALASLSPSDLRVGSRFTGERAKVLDRALADCRETITRGPVKYTSHPGRAAPLFVYRGRRRRPRSPTELVLDQTTLERYGQLVVGRPLWETLGRHACWIEPALTHEWVRLMRRFDQREGRERPLDAYLGPLTWLDPQRDTQEVRMILRCLLEAEGAIPCTWSGRSLRSMEQIEVDHVFPFSRWPNGDLWNLAPAARSVNQAKRDRLPSAEALDAARAPLAAWWEQAYLPTARARFEREARAALPAMGSGQSSDAQALWASVVDGMHAQRLRLRVDQQLGEWTPSH